MRWHSEVENYSYDLRRSFNNKVVGHYTQVRLPPHCAGRLKLNSKVQELEKKIKNKNHGAFCPPLGCVAQFKRGWLWNGPLPQV